MISQPVECVSPVVQSNCSHVNRNRVWWQTFKLGSEEYRFLHNILLLVVIVFLFIFITWQTEELQACQACPDPSLFMCMLRVCLWVWACFLRFIFWSSTWLRAESSYTLIGQLFTLFCRPLWMHSSLDPSSLLAGTLWAVKLMLYRAHHILLTDFNNLPKKVPVFYNSCR